MREWQPFAKTDLSVDVPSLEKLVPGVMQKIGLDQRLRESQIRTHWREIVGTEVARHAQPASLNKGVLIVHIDHPIWHQQLQSHKALVLQKVRARVGEKSVRQIVFRIG